MFKLRKSLMKFMTKFSEVIKMSMTERILFWLGILILVVGLIGIKADISKLEQQLQQTVQASSEGGEEQ